MRGYKDAPTTEKTENGEIREESESDRLPKEVGERAESDKLPDEVGEKNGKKDVVDKNKNDVSSVREMKDIPEKMQPSIVIKFKYPEKCDKAEFRRQVKAQERGINGQSVAENRRNREAYQERKEQSEVGNGRAKEAAEAQKRVRDKAYQSHIASNMKKGMSYREAKVDADTWIKSQAALHNPDQIAGGDPNKVSRMGDARVNSSIGSQWRARVQQLDKAVKQYAEGRSEEELLRTKMNVKLEVE